MCIVKSSRCGVKWVCESRILRVERRGRLNTSVSRKTARSNDISQVNLMVGPNELAKRKLPPSVKHRKDAELLVHLCDP